MKKAAPKKQKQSPKNKISSYFTLLSRKAQEKSKTPSEVICVDSDHDLVFSSPRVVLNGKSEDVSKVGEKPVVDAEPRTPERKKRKQCRDSPSPDIIPCSLHPRDQNFKSVINRPWEQHRKKIAREEVEVASESSCEKENSPKELNCVKSSLKKGCLSLSRLKGTLDELYREIEGDKSNLSENGFGRDEEIESNLNSLLDDSWDGSIQKEEELDLSTSQHCKLINIEEHPTYLLLTVQSTKVNRKAVCKVEESWIHTKFVIGDTLRITAKYNEASAVWLVSNDSGLIVYEPDHLLSTTSVVGALMCTRRAVLRERFHGFEPSNKIMVVGVLVHQLLQEVLRNNITEREHIQAVMRKLLLDRDTLWKCYESCLSIEELEKELTEFVPRIITFIKQYVHKGSAEGLDKENWRGKIDKIQDIEENIWCPSLGVKGKVDVSVKSGLAVMPLELKTGRASMSLEHRGQVIFYIMMMREFGYHLPSGLLLYLREGALREIALKGNEERDLIMLRNELMYYLNCKPTLGENASLVHPNLPEPVNRPRICSNCPYSAICCSYLHFETDVSQSPLKEIEKDVLSHLEPCHLQYFVKWSSLLALEATAQFGNKEVREIYTIPPEERERKGQCIINLRTKSAAVESGGLYKHTFEKAAELSFLLSGIQLGGYVVVSTDTRPAVATGFVTELDRKSITVELDRDLCKRYPNQQFHLDSYSSSISQTFNMSCLALLLEASEQAKRLRDIVITRRLPTFTKVLPQAVATKGTPILRNLNKVQQKAVLKAISAVDYLLIKGMPGTGKTATIVSLIEILVQMKKTVLVTSHTHSAVDNVCIRLQERGVKVLRLGRENKIHEKLHPCSEKTATDGCKTLEELEEAYNKPAVLAVTCLGSGHPVLSKRRMDVCVVDESTQVLQCSVFKALHAADKFILIGDPDQLPPVIKNRDAAARGLSESLFERLDQPGATVTLTMNYRMNKVITDMANALTYEGQLLVANEDVGNATLHLPLKEDFVNHYKDKPWIMKVLDESLEASVCILDTGPVHQKPLPSTKDDKYSNCKECAIILTITKALIKGGVAPNSIGVIAPFRSQVALLSSVLPVEASTVDQFQGRDKDIIFYSCTKSCDDFKAATEFEILEDKRRLTVAVTRAKRKFILLGDLKTVRKYTPFARLLSSLDDRCFLKLEDGKLGFWWSEVEGDEPEV